MPDFVEAIVKATGQRQTIPCHWADHPVLGSPFEPIITDASADLTVTITADSTEFDAAMAGVVDAIDELRSRKVPELRAYAEEYGIDLSGLRKHDEITAAIVAHFDQPEAPAGEQSPAPDQVRPAEESTEAQPAQNTKE